MHIQTFLKIRKKIQDQNFSDYQFVDYMYKNLENEDFTNFTQSLENAVFPKCQVRNKAYELTHI